MSDGTSTLADSGGSGSTASAPAPAAPQSTQSIAASVIESAEQADASSTSDAGETRLDTRNTPTEEGTTTAAKPTEAELSAAAQFLLKQGHQFKKVDGRETWLPIKTVEKMLDRYVETHKSTWTGEKTTLESQAKELRQYFDTLRSSVAGDPKAFLSELAGIDPRYQSFLDGATAPARQASANAADDPMPQPDYDLGNGKATYSLDGLQKLREWDKRQTLREMEAKIDERFKPVAEREKAERERAERDRILGEARERSVSQLQEAQSWPLFGKLAEDDSLTEFQQGVLDELKKDSEAAAAAGKRPTLTLEGAYIRRASQRYTEDDTARRERLLKEINAAPKSTALPRQTTDSTGRKAPLTTADIARKVIASAEKG